MPASKFIDVPLGPWIPDNGGSPDPVNQGYLTVCDNVYLTHYGYKPLPGFASVGGLAVVPADPKTGSMHLTGGSTVLDIFAGSDTALYQSDCLGAATWSAWSTVTPSTTVTSGAHWAFEQFDDLILASNDNRVDPIWEKSLTDSTATLFATLGGSPPVCWDIARIRNHVMGVLRDSVEGGAEDYAVQWCAVGDPTDWPTPGTADALSKESGKEYLPRELGVVVGIQGGEKFGLIFQEYGITRATYVGGDIVFEFDTFERRVGGSEAQPDSYIWFNGWLYFCWASQGIFRTDGYRVEEVSVPIRESLFLDTLSHTWGGNKPGSTGVDGVRNNLYFLTQPALHGSGSATALVYNGDTNSWSVDASSALDSNVFSGPNHTADPIPRLWNVNSSHQPQVNTSATAPSIDLQTGFIEVSPGRKVELEGVHLVGRELPGSLTIAYKAIQDYDSIDMVETGFTNLTSQSRGIKDTGRAKGLLFAFKVTGTSDLNQNIRSLRIYYRDAEPI